MHVVCCSPVCFFSFYKYIFYFVIRAYFAYMCSFLVAVKTEFGLLLLFLYSILITNLVRLNVCECGLFGIFFYFSLLFLHLFIPVDVYLHRKVNASAHNSCTHSHYSDRFVFVLRVNNGTTKRNQVPFISTTIIIWSTQTALVCVIKRGLNVYFTIFMIGMLPKF